MKQKNNLGLLTDKIISHIISIICIWHVLLFTNIFPKYLSLARHDKCIGRNINIKYEKPKGFEVVLFLSLSHNNPEKHIKGTFKTPFWANILWKLCCILAVIGTIAQSQSSECPKSREISIPYMSLFRPCAIISHAECDLHW